MGKDKKKPDGGWDKTPLPPTQGPTYTLRIIFHSAAHLPVADLPVKSSDPFVLAQCNTHLRTRHKSDPPVRFRSATARRSLTPRWDAEWVIAGVPADGCEIKTRVYDEDNGSHDDLLGRVHIYTGPLSEGWKNEQTYQLTSRGANWRAWGLRNCMKPVSEEARKDATISVSFEVLGRTEVEVGKVYTVNNFWFTHYSPLLGRVVHTTSPDDDHEEAANFQANQLQLRGPVPNELYLRYVNFHAFVPWMFESKGLRGRILNKALHRQHEQVYHFDAETEYGRLPGPGRAMAQRFLDLTYWGEGNRVFTYVLTLDGLLRFTEMGPEFGIDMLSKHTMHSDVNVYIAFSGEFFIRKYKPDAPGEREAEGHERNSLDIELEDEPLEKPGEGRGLAEQSSSKPRGSSGSNTQTEGNGNAEKAHLNSGEKEPDLKVEPHRRGPDERSKSKKLRSRRRKAREAQYDTPPEETTLHGPDSRNRPTDPSFYELVIDNDSGTYRPDKKLLPILAKFLQDQFDGLHVAVLGCDDDVDQKIKKRRLKAKQKSGGRRLFTQANSSNSSISSSDQEDFEEGRAHKGGKEKGLDFITDPAKFAKKQYHDGVDKIGKKHHGKHVEGSAKDRGDADSPDSASVATGTTDGTGAATATDTATNEKLGVAAAGYNDSATNEKAAVAVEVDPNSVQSARDPEKM